MKITFQILLFTFALLLHQTAFAATHFKDSTSSNFNISTQKNLLKTAKKSWRKPNNRIKKETGKHGFGGIIGVVLGLTALFVGLKLANIIAWSWIWVVAPIWITLGLMILIIVYVIILFLLMPEPMQIEEIPSEELSK